MPIPFHPSPNTLSKTKKCSLSFFLFNKDLLIAYVDEYMSVYLLTAYFIDAFLSLSFWVCEEGVFDWTFQREKEERERGDGL